MMLKDQKTSIIEANRTHETDTGSPEVQVAILTGWCAGRTTLLSHFHTCCMGSHTKPLAVENGPKIIILT